MALPVGNEVTVAADVSDRAGRLLGVIASITSAVDISDRAARLLGAITGNVASGTADSGNPVKVGGVFNTVLPSLLSGQRADAQLDSSGRLIVSPPDVSDRSARQIGKASLWDGSTSSNTAVNLPSALDGLGTGAIAALAANAVAVFSDGATLRLARTPTIFKTATLTAAGSNAVWTPAVGKKFRLMGYIIEVTENASLAVGAINTFSWLDAAAAINLVHSDFEPTTAVTTGLVGYTTGMISLGNGYLSTAANNVLNLSIGTALATGAIRVNVWGTEE